MKYIHDTAADIRHNCNLHEAIYMKKLNLKKQN